MVAMNFVSRVPNSPFLNESFYIVWGFGGATFTAAFTSVASFVSEVRSSGGSFVSLYPAGTVATGAYTIKGYVVKGTDGTYNNTASITIRNSDIADPVVTVYDLLRNGVGTTYASTAFSTGWYSSTVRYPQVTVTRMGRTDQSFNLFDTFRKHEDTIVIDTWVSARAFGVGQKNAHTLLDDEIKRIINVNRKDPGTKLRHMQITSTVPLHEISDNRRIFRSRLTVRIQWHETIG